jgi:hypothetical protein
MKNKFIIKKNQKYSKSRRINKILQQKKNRFKIFKKFSIGKNLY